MSSLPIFSIKTRIMRVLSQTENDMDTETLAHFLAVAREGNIKEDYDK